MKKVTIYTTPVCPYCIKAKQLLDSLGVFYETVDVAENPEIRKKIMEEHNWRTVPAIFADDELLGGFDDISRMHAEGNLMEKIGA